MFDPEWLFDIRIFLERTSSILVRAGLDLSSDILCIVFSSRLSNILQDIALGTANLNVYHKCLNQMASSRW